MPRQMNWFCRLVLDFSYAGAGEVVRHYFVVPVLQADIRSFDVREGQGAASYSYASLQSMARVTPYDAIAIWQHAASGQIGSRYRGET